MTRTKKQYTDDFKTTLVDLSNSRKSLADIGRKYGIAKSKITIWANKSKPIVVDKSKVITAAEYQGLLKRWHGLKTRKL